MAGFEVDGGRLSRDEWAAQVAALVEDGRISTRDRPDPVTRSRVVDAALEVVAADGYPALTMRRLATSLRVTPGALYVHVRDRAELDDLMIGRLSAEIDLPAPDPSAWREQFLDTCRQLRDRYLHYPGIAQAVFVTAPLNLDSLRVADGLLTILLSGGVSSREAAWTVDSALLYVASHCLVALRRYPEGENTGTVDDREEIAARFRMLPATRFPGVHAVAEDLVSGEGVDRFDFTIRLLLDGLTHRNEGRAR